jgi:ATP-dependent Clp protease ATP-binding subunit ClpA
MSKFVTYTRKEKTARGAAGDLRTALECYVVGQSTALDAVIPSIHMYLAGLSPEGRPAGVFLLLGPSGTGKTRTVEALAAALHGSEKSMLRVDCGEFQMEHEVAKLIGAPPGYLGHKETQPMLTQAKLNSVTSEHSSLSIVLLDEIEKASPSLTRLLLGVLDKGILRLGDNTTVNFERSLIFMTSNLGSRDMLREIVPDFGFGAAAGAAAANVEGKLAKVGLQAVKSKFPPEFVNRIDSVVTYQPLNGESLRAILSNQLLDLQDQIFRRLGARAFYFEVSEESRRFLLEKGTSPQYGARELKRTIHRHIVQPLATMVVRGEVMPGSTMSVTLRPDGEGLTLAPYRARLRRSAARAMNVA